MMMMMMLSIGGFFLLAYDGTDDMILLTLCCWDNDMMNRFVSAEDRWRRGAVGGCGRSRRTSSVSLRSGRKFLVRPQMVQRIAR